MTLGSDDAGCLPAFPASQQAAWCIGQQSPARMLRRMRRMPTTADVQTRQHYKR